MLANIKWVGWIARQRPANPAPKPKPTPSHWRRVATKAWPAPAVAHNSGMAGYRLDGHHRVLLFIANQRQTTLFVLVATHAVKALATLFIIHLADGLDGQVSAAVAAGLA